MLKVLGRGDKSYGYNFKHLQFQDTWRRKICILIIIYKFRQANIFSKTFPGGFNLGAHITPINLFHQI